MSYQGKVGEEYFPKLLVSSANSDFNFTTFDLYRMSFENKNETRSSGKN
jgi:hypothetical protein